MTVTVNGEPAELAPGSTVADVVHRIAGVGPGGDGGTRTRAGVAVAVNGEVVPRSAWGERTLHDDERIEVLAALGGG